MKVHTEGSPYFWFVLEEEIVCLILHEVAPRKRVGLMLVWLSNKGQEVRDTTKSVSMAHEPLLLSMFLCRLQKFRASSAFDSFLCSIAQSLMVVDKTSMVCQWFWCTKKWLSNIVNALMNNVIQSGQDNLVDESSHDVQCMKKNFLGSIQWSLKWPLKRFWIHSPEVNA